MPSKPAPRPTTSKTARTRKKMCPDPVGHLPILGTPAEGAVAVLESGAIEGALEESRKAGDHVEVYGGVPTSPKILSIRLGQIIVPTANGGRGATIDDLVKDPETEELAASIRQVGLLHPIGVVHAPKFGPPDGEAYELRWGRRRIAALRILGWTVIQATVLPSDTPRAVLDAASGAENAQRKALTMLEECTMVVHTLDSIERSDPDSAGEFLDLAPDDNMERVKPVDIADLVLRRDSLNRAAEILGKSVEWVSNRAYLARLRGKRARALALSGRLSLGNAAAISRLADSDRQDEIAEWAARLPDGTGGMNTDYVRGRVERYLGDLKHVPWRLEIPFAGGPACDTCPHNSANAPGLFGDAPEPMCTNRPCFSRKMSASNSQIRNGIERAVRGKDKAGSMSASVALAQPSAIKPGVFQARVRKSATGKSPSVKAGATAVARMKRDQEADRRQRERDDLDREHRHHLATRAGKLFRGIMAAAKKKPRTLQALGLLAKTKPYSDVFHDDRGGFTPALSKLIRAAAEPKPDLALIAEAVPPITMYEFGNEYAMGKREDLLQAMAKAFGVELAPMPEKKKPKPDAKS